jgi:hypothetical protein
MLTAQPTDKCLYYIQHLQTLFQVVETPPVNIAAETRA